MIKRPFIDAAEATALPAPKYISPRGSARVRALLGTTALAIILTVPGFVEPSYAQVSGENLFGAGEVNPAAQMLLEADELIYNEAENSVTAVGNVQLAYDGYTLVAKRVTYERATGRVIATGAVEIVEPNGNRVFAEEIDVTDDFQNGFVDALRVETPENSRFIAESAERRDGEIAVFNNGVYTACEPCKESPAKPPIWQIRSNRVIINNTTKTVSYEGASFELWGKPIAYLPRFSHGDPSIKRKSGFIFDAPGQSPELGVHGGLAYFWNLAPNYDLTLGGRYYLKQGFMGYGEWRHRTENGQYSLSFYNIEQRQPDEFDENTIDRNVDHRTAFTSSGKFDINPRWQFGWKALVQSDDNFARTYGIHSFDTREITNEAYLIGLNGKNYFDARAQEFLIQDFQDDQLTNNLYPGQDRFQDQQALLLPSFDYNVVSEENFAGGQVSIDVNVVNIDRSEVDIANFDAGVGLTAPNERYHGLEGNYTRASSEAEWKASSIFNGALLTTSLSVRGDAIGPSTYKLDTEYNPLNSDESIYRAMPAAMFEIRYPLISNHDMASHIFEPIAQVIVRPDETNIGEFQNEDAQSMVFETNNLFERSKFSGFDRVEGGSRANVGFRYSTSFRNNMSVDIVAGQSYHLHGKNSYAERDLVNAGIESGLETDRSDYVASIEFDTGSGLAIGLDGRFDEQDLALRSGVVGARYIDTSISLSGSYIFIDEQPRYALSEDRHEIRGSASLRLTDRWRLFGNASYDIQNDNTFARGVGIAYDDSCTSLSIAYQQAESRYTGEASDQRITFRLGLRTIGETQFAGDLYDPEENN